MRRKVFKDAIGYYIKVLTKKIYLNGMKKEKVPKWISGNILETIITKIMKKKRKRNKNRKRKVQAKKIVGPTGLIASGSTGISYDMLKNQAELAQKLKQLEENPSTSTDIVQRDNNVDLYKMMAQMRLYQLNNRGLKNIVPQSTEPPHTITIKPHHPSVEDYIEEDEQPDPDIQIYNSQIEKATTIPEIKARLKNAEEEVDAGQFWKNRYKGLTYSQKKQLKEIRNNPSLKEKLYQSFIQSGSRVHGLPAKQNMSEFLDTTRSSSSLSSLSSSSLSSSSSPVKQKEEVPDEELQTILKDTEALQKKQQELRKLREDVNKSLSVATTRAEKEIFTKKLDDLNSMLHEIAVQLGNGKNTNLANGMSNLQIDAYMSNWHKKGIYLGTFSRDEIPKRIIQLTRQKITMKHPIAWIYNTDPSNKGGRHWRAMFVDNASFECFDSFSTPIDKRMQEDIKRIVTHLNPNVYLKLKENRIQWQPDRGKGSTDCGAYCLQFLQRRLRGESFSKVTGYDQLKKNQTKLGQKELEKFKALPKFRDIIDNVE